MEKTAVDPHRSAAAWLAIIFGVLGLLTMATLGLFFGGLLMLAASGTPYQGLLLSFGGVVLGLLSMFALLDVIAGIAVLNGSKAGEIWLILSSVLSLFKFPIGTALGAYTLWALLRDVPVPAPALGAAPAGARAVADVQDAHILGPR